MREKPTLRIGALSLLRGGTLNSSDEIVKERHQRGENLTLLYGREENNKLED